jgi:hypothetical protein
MIGLTVPFTVSSTGRISTTTDYNAIIRGQIVDALMTNQGERTFRATYGSDLQSALFNPNDAMVRSDAANRIKERIQSLSSRVIVEYVRFSNPERDNGVLNVDIQYRPSLIQDSQILTIPLMSDSLSQKQVGA